MIPLVLSILRNALQCQPGRGLGTALALLGRERGMVGCYLMQYQPLSIQEHSGLCSVEDAAQFSGRSAITVIDVAIASGLNEDHLLKSGRCRTILTPT
ncbi:MAG: hypothetical protein ACFB4I_25010 [Cyanophyceae cyanobacterium]